MLTSFGESGAALQAWFHAALSGMVRPLRTA